MTVLNTIADALDDFFQFLINQAFPALVVLLIILAVGYTCAYLVEVILAIVYVWPRVRVFVRISVLFATIITAVVMTIKVLDLDWPHLLGGAVIVAVPLVMNAPLANMVDGWFLQLTERIEEGDHLSVAGVSGVVVAFHLNSLLLRNLEQRTEYILRYDIVYHSITARRMDDPHRIVATPLQPEWQRQQQQQPAQLGESGLYATVRRQLVQ